MGAPWEKQVNQSVCKVLKLCALHERVLRAIPDLREHANAVDAFRGGTASFCTQGETFTHTHHLFDSPAMHSKLVLFEQRRLRWIDYELIGAAGTRRSHSDPVTNGDARPWLLVDHDGAATL